MMESESEEGNRLKGLNRVASESEQGNRRK